MIRGKKLRPLAVIGDKPVELDGYGVIEPLTKSMPGFKAPGQLLRHLHPKGVPPEVIATVEKIWTEQMVNSPRSSNTRRAAARSSRRSREPKRRRSYSPRCRRTRGRRPIPARRRSRPTRSESRGRKLRSKSHVVAAPLAGGTRRRRNRLDHRGLRLAAAPRPHRRASCGRRSAASSRSCRGRWTG
jgi:hypothetical protein